MSGLAALLAGHHEPGLYRWQSGLHVEDIRHTVEHAGWRFFHVDGWPLEEKDEVIDAMAEAFGFPEWFGQNFDALSDSLGDVQAGDSAGVVFLWDGWGPFARHDEQAFSVTLSVLGGRAHADRGGKFAVVLRGEGPSVDVPELGPSAG